MSVRTVIEVRARVHAQYCRVRAILRILESDEFKAAFEHCDAESRVEVGTIIERINKDELEKWLFKQLKLEQMPIRELRKLGQQLSVRGYHCLPKSVLVERIKVEQSKHDKNSTANA